MRIELTAVAKGRRDEALPPTSLRFVSGRATLVIAETEQRPTVLGLIASGRMTPDAGGVTLDDVADRAAIRRRVALVDAPLVSEPAPDIATVGVVGEELMFAGRPSDPLAARRFLDAHGLRHLSRTPIADISPADRLRLLLELAVLRPGVDGIVLVSPDRHGGDPADWWRLAQEVAGRGLAVLVIAGHAAAELVDRTPSARRPLPSRVRPHRLVRREQSR